MIISMSMISTIYCLRLHYTLGQYEIPSFMRAFFPFAHKYLWLPVPPSRPFDHEPSGSPKVAPKEGFETTVTGKKAYAELVKKVRLFQAQVIKILLLKSLVRRHKRSFQTDDEKSELMKELHRIHEELKFMSDRTRDEELTSAYEEEWKYAALIVDRYPSRFYNLLTLNLRVAAMMFVSGLFISFFITILYGTVQT